MRAVALLLALASMPAAQDQRPVFRAGTRTVMVPVSVTDTVGNTVRDLERADFELRDAGQVQEITFFDRQIQPITAIMLIDGSASMHSSLSGAIAAANELVVRLLPGDRVRIGSFSEEFRMMPEYTGNRDTLLAYLANEFNIHLGRRTRLWDTMDRALTELATVDGRRVLIVISDGRDTWSLKAYDDVRRRAGRNDIAITFARVRPMSNAGQIAELRQGSNGSGGGERKPLPANAFEMLAWETGGALVPLDARLQMDAPFTQLVLDLHGQYVLGFTPRALDGKEHALDVKVKRSHVKVTARRSYVAEVEK